MRTVHQTLPARISTQLQKLGLTPDQVGWMPDADLLVFPGIGKGTLNEIRKHVIPAVEYREVMPISMAVGKVLLVKADRAEAAHLLLCIATCRGFVLLDDDGEIRNSVTWIKR